MNTSDPNQQENLSPVQEPVIRFNSISDRDVYKIISENNADITLIEITGYDLQINFNMEYLRSYQDVKAAADAVGQLFQEIMLEKLLEYKQKQ